MTLKERDERVSWDIDTSTVKLTDVQDYVDDWDEEAVSGIRFNSAIHIKIKLSDEGGQRTALFRRRRKRSSRGLKSIKIHGV